MAFNGGGYTLSYGHYGTGPSITTAALTPNTFSHVALVRAGSTVTLYVNGVSAGSVTDTTVFTTAGLLFGGTGTASQYFTGYLDEWRISKNARWLTNFTPPTAAYSLGTGFALQTLPLTANNNTPANGRIVLRHQDLLGTVVPGTDLLVDVSSNGGTTWNTVTGLTKADPWDATTNIITGSITLTGGGTNMLCRIRTANNKPQRIRAEGCYWN